MNMFKYHFIKNLNYSEYSYGIKYSLFRFFAEFRSLYTSVVSVGDFLTCSVEAAAAHEY